MPCTPCSLRVALIAAAVPALAGFAFVGQAMSTQGGGLVSEPGEVQAGPNVLKQSFELIDGTKTSFEAYKGKVVMVVNTASRCGLTPQYEALEKLYRAHKDDGLVVIGFPANNFMGQEPGTNAEIAEFCSERFDVSFPMAAKVSVKGEDAHPLYKQLAALPAPLGGEPGWNFTQFVVDREGNVVARFEPRVKPDDATVVSKLSELLQAD